MSMTQVMQSVNNAPGMYLFWCPACEGAHHISDGWTFDGDMEKPTISPSIHVRSSPVQKSCHFFVKAGIIQYLTDCEHELKGQSVPMVPMPWDDDTE